MYGLPKGLSLEFLSGQTLVQIGIGMHDLGLYFHNDVSIMVTSRIVCPGPDATEHEHEDFKKAAPDLMVFLNQAITKAEGSEDGTLRLSFDTGQTLTIYDDSAEYESYTIRHGDRVIVV